MSLCHLVAYSGGIGSWGAAKRVAAQHGTEKLILLFADTKSEDPDTYRFLRQSAANVGGQLVEIADGRNIWQVFEDERYLGNTRADPCSRILKRQMADRWREAHCDPAQTVVYIGIDWSEGHRFERWRQRMAPWECRAPLCEPPYLTKADLHRWAESEGLEKQHLYRIGSAHANCGGGCIKMGQGGFVRLLRAHPERYREWEEHEQRLRDLLGDVAILRDRRGGKARALTLRELRLRVEAGYQPDLFDIGGCGCFTDIPEE